MDIYDIDALLEAPYQQQKEAEKKVDTLNRNSENDRNTSNNNGRPGSLDRRRSRSPRRESSDQNNSNRSSSSHSYHGNRDRRYRSRSPSGRNYGGGNRKYSGGSSSEYNNKSTRPRSPSDDNRDKKTVFVTQLAQRVRSPELFDFFRSVGRIRGARVVFDKISKRSKGVGYVEFHEETCVPKAIAMTGKKLCGIPIVVLPSEAEKNRLAEEAALEQEKQKKAMNNQFNRLYVASIHYNISSADLKKVFEPFGEIEEVSLVKDPNGKFKGVAYISYADPKDAKKALDTMNGFELAGRQIRVGIANEKQAGVGSLDDSETLGLSMSAKARVDLMKKLAARDVNYLNEEGNNESTPPERSSSPAPSSISNVIQIAKSEQPTRCVILMNMYNPLEETDPNWTADIEAEVKEECQKQGKVIHIFVPGSINGQVFMACSALSTAVSVKEMLHTRYFAGRQVSAWFLDESEYFKQFDLPLQPSS